MINKLARLEIERPILYSFRRCPFAIRARMAIFVSGLKVELREIELRNKPKSLLSASPKGTVPVLILGEGTVIEESRDIIIWALKKNDPQEWFKKFDVHEFETAERLIDENDFFFKPWLDKYKYFDRNPEFPQLYYLDKCKAFLVKLDEKLKKTRFLMGGQLSYVDIAIFPFIRQFSNVDSSWFEQCPYCSLRRWLRSLLKLDCFTNSMDKYQPWSESARPIVFPSKT